MDQTIYVMIKIEIKAIKSGGSTDWTSLWIYFNSLFNYYWTSGSTDRTEN